MSKPPTTPATDCALEVEVGHLRQALAEIGCSVCADQLGCCVGGSPGGIPKLADLILDAIRDAGWRLVRSDP